MQQNFSYNMAEAVEDFSCPICLEVLKPPVRITSCGHNFCEECLVKLCSRNRPKSCPTCRATLGVAKNEINKLTRNRLLEEAIEKIKSQGGKNPRSRKPPITVNALPQLKGAAHACLSSGNHDKALRLLEMIIIEEKGARTILPLLQKARCEIICGFYSDAKITCNKIARMTKTIEFENERVEFKQKCHDELDQLVKMFIEINESDTALLLIRSQFHLIKHSYQAQEKLQKLHYLGIPIKTISKNLQYQRDATRSKEYYFLLNQILSEMQSIINVEIKVKTLNIAWLMYNYGLCCNFLKDFTKSTYIHAKAIFLMQSNFGNNAGNYMVYGSCHHNFANALVETNRFNEARHMYEEALKYKEQALDWENVEQQRESLLLTKRKLQN